MNRSLVHLALLLGILIGAIAGTAASQYGMFSALGIAALISVLFIRILEKAVQ